MLGMHSLKRTLATFLPERGLSLTWIKRDRDAWLGRRLDRNTFRPPSLREAARLEATAERVNALGAQPLWEGYRAVYRQDANVPFSDAAMQRLPDQVRTKPQMGRLFAWLATERRPELLVEVGTAFGVSAMYWGTGLQHAGRGKLVTFDPNPVWHRIAAEHLAAFGDVVQPVLGTFEDNFHTTLGDRAIGLAFVDAIHTSAFVDAQVDMLLPHMESGALLVLDDITFSDDMRACWQRWGSDARVRASVAVDDRVGLLELAPVARAS
jgi:predicted O-methyltransferase YrrM